MIGGFVLNSKLNWLTVVFLFGLLIALSGCEMIGGGTIKLSKDHTYYQRAQENQSPDIYIYDAVRHEVTTKTNLSVHLWGIPCSVGRQKSCENKQIDYRSDKNYEFVQIRLKNKGDGLVDVTYSGTIHSTVAGNVVTVPYNFTAETKLTQGTWKDYQEGKNVRLVYTRKGKKSARQELKNIIQNTLKQEILKAYQQSENEVTLEDVQLKRYSCKDYGMIDMNLNEIQARGGDCTLKIKVRASFSVRDAID